MIRLRLAMVVSGLTVCLALATAQETQGQPTDVPQPLLNERTIGRDISTAGFYELVAWLQGLGLSTAGDREALVARLREYYAVPPDPAQAEEERDLVVDSATRTRYFTRSDIEERYVRLSGGVTLTLRDEERDVSHRIVADEVTFNQDLNILSASGDVVYTLDRGGTVEQFSGAALTVQLDDWEGAFVEGVTQRPRTIDGREVDFAFAGSYITRSIDDVVVMENGRVTSSQAVPPNYEIRAQKIWVLSPGEWGLRSALLYVGRVPVFYFPFFFRPGDELFFNPSVGSREREGRYIQTTTYLIGQADEPESAFSFLQIAQEEETAARTRREGLFLVPDETLDPSTEPSTAELRLLTDLYTKLGAYVALDGSFPSAGPISNLDFFAGLGVTRHLYRYTYAGRGTTYSPYYIVDGMPVTSWNASQIGPVRIPFRFGLGLAGTLQGSGTSLSADMAYYSDSRFTADFDAREEQIDWLGILGQGSTGPSASPVSSFDWTLRSAVTPRIDPPVPWLQRAQIQNAAITLRWRELTIQTQPELVSRADNSPEARFFYPDTLDSPSISGLVSGQILQLSSGSTSDREQPDVDESPLRPPWAELSVQPLTSEETLRLPPLRESLPAPQVPELWRTTIGYSITPSGLVESRFNSSEWDSPGDVDFTIAYSAASGRLVANLPASASFFSNAVSLNGSLGATGQYRTLFNRNESVDDATWDSLLVQSYSYSSVNATSNLTARAAPFPGSQLWAKSSVSYSLNLLLYQLIYSEALGTGSPPYLSQGLEWDEDSVRAHQVQLTAAMSVFGEQQLRLSVDLPPRNPRLVGQLDLRYRPISVSVASALARDDEGEWTLQPITSSQTLVFAEVGQIQNQLSYEPMDATFSYNTTAATIGPAQARFEMRSSEGYTFGGPGVGWVADGEERFRPARAELSASVSREFEPFWRDRLFVSGELTSGWSMNLLRYTESAFTFGAAARLEITDFLSLNISSQSSNSQSYIYIQPLAEGVGRERRSLALDLLRSFNFFSRPQRVESAFNLQQIRLEAVHELEDWDLEVSYAGQPEIVRVTDPDTGETRRAYDWQGVLDIELSWRAIKELSSTVVAENETGPDGGSRWDLSFGNDS